MHLSSWQRLMVLLQSAPIVNFVTCIFPDAGTMATSAMPTHYPLELTTMHTPRLFTGAVPVRRAVEWGAGHGSHPAAWAVALSMSISCWSVVWLIRN